MYNMAKLLKSICTPALIYFAISMFIFIGLVIQNLGTETFFCVGPYECYSENKTTIFLVKFLYILFVTWLLDTFCRAGYGMLSWLLVILPILLMFVTLMGYIFFQSGTLNL